MKNLIAALAFISTSAFAGYGSVHPTYGFLMMYEPLTYTDPVSGLEEPWPTDRPTSFEWIKPGVGGCVLFYCYTSNPVRIGYLNYCGTYNVAVGYVRPATTVTQGLMITATQTEDGNGVAIVPCTPNLGRTVHFTNPTATILPVLPPPAPPPED